MRLTNIAPLALVILAAAACDGNGFSTGIDTPFVATSGNGNLNNANGTVLSINSGVSQANVGTQVPLAISVTQNGAAVPDGTLVQLSATGGTFGGTNSGVTTVTTTGGVALVTLGSTAAGNVVVTATAGGATSSATVAFR